MFPSPDAFFTESRFIIDRFSAWVAQTGVDALADHICYKCGSREEFVALRTMFETESVFIYQSIISQRPIAVIRMASVIASPLGDIAFLELSDQKPDGSQVSGFDHIEIFSRTRTMDDLALDLEAKGVIFTKVVRPHHTTYDADLGDGFKVRLTSEHLVDKIKRDEMMIV